MEIHQKISTPNYQRLKTMDKRSIDQKLRLQNFDARHEKSKQVQWSRVTGIKWRWKRKRYLLPVERKGAVFEGTKAVSGMRVTIVRNRHRKPNHPLSHNLQKHEVEVCRETEMPEAEASLRNSLDRRVNTSWKVPAPNRLVSIGILPSVNTIKRNQERDQRTDEQNARVSFPTVWQQGTCKKFRVLRSWSGYRNKFSKPFHRSVISAPLNKMLACLSYSSRAGDRAGNSRASGCGAETGTSCWGHAGETLGACATARCRTF